MSPHSKSIAAVILAAGESSRFGRLKQFVQFEGKTLVRRVVDAAGEAECLPVIVVTGNAHDEVKHELRECNAIAIENKDWKAGIGTSIRTGIEYLIDNAPDADATLLLVCDQPFVDCNVLSGLVAMHRGTGKPVVASAYANTLGVPALFNRLIFPELLRLSGDSGAKAIILSNRAHVAEFSFPRGDIDVDTMGDLESIPPAP
jgi:molybdenum cofactor cytidylyltransferase